ncbi:hypothetical protein [Streptomyces sp. NPDC046759]|uniref:hypothetical protein n=1 Tax=Streptomyces sp. NPDC046759 TaxID=3155019 RepID=UPI0033CED7F7
MAEQAFDGVVPLYCPGQGRAVTRPRREVTPRDHEVRARALIDEFFDRGMSLYDEAAVRWRADGRLDQVAVTQIRMWMANRTLAAFVPGASDAVRARLVAERTTLEGWLTDHGFVQRA